MLGCGELCRQTLVYELGKKQFTRLVLPNRRYKTICHSLSALRDEETYRKNILLIKRSLLTGFLFFPLGTSVHI
jgi:hypothetical protein